MYVAKLEFELETPGSAVRGATDWAMEPGSLFYESAVDKFINLWRLLGIMVKFFKSRVKQFMEIVSLVKSYFLGKKKTYFKMLSAAN